MKNPPLSTRLSIILLALIFSSLAQAATYEDTFVIKPGKRGAFIEDINVWGYTTEFAKRFGMPLEWADDSFKGAYGAAFRVETRTARWVNLFGDPNKGMPHRDCILDIFVDSRAPIPWRDDLPVDFDLNSQFALTKLIPQNKEVDQRRHGENVGLYGIVAQLSSENGRYSTGMTVNLYVRDVYPGVTYISFNMACVTPTKTRSIINFKSKENRQPVYSIELPASFMQRLYDRWYAKERKATEQEFKGNIQDFRDAPHLPQISPSQPPTPEDK